MGDEAVDRAASRRLPLLFIASLSGLVAALCGLAALATTGIAKSIWGFTFAAFVFLTPACAAAVAVVVVVGLPVHALIKSVGFTSRWMYVAGFLAIIGACYFWLLGYRESDFAFLAPIAAIPSGLLFHHLAYRAGTSPSWSDRDWFIVGSWFCAWTFFVVSFVYRTQHPPPDPWHTREAVLHTGLVAGGAIVMLCGIAAGLARIWNVRLAMLIAGTGWAVPIVFTVAVFMTPLGPEQIRFTAGDRTFDIDWHWHPRRESSGFSFDASGRGPYEFIGRRQANRRVYISETDSSLTARLTELGADHLRRSSTAVLACEDFDPKPKRMRRVCTMQDDQGSITTLIECDLGFCFHRFNAGGLGYGLHCDPDDLVDWSETEKRAIQLVSELGKIRVPDGSRIRRSSQ